MSSQSTTTEPHNVFTRITQQDVFKSKTFSENTCNAVRLQLSIVVSYRWVKVQVVSYIDVFTAHVTTRSFPRVVNTKAYSAAVDVFFLCILLRQHARHDVRRLGR